jgi:nucleotide-binding universal stress UspA family protein
VRKLISGLTKFGSILVAVDGSASAQRAVEVAIEQAKAFSAKLTILYIVEIPVTPFFPDKETEIDERKVREGAKTEGEKMVSSAASLAEARGVKMIKQEVMRHTGHSTAEGIIDYAKKNAADLIVVGTTGLGGIKKLLLGSVANDVVGSAHCSVLVVR